MLRITRVFGAFVGAVVLAACSSQDPTGSSSEEWTTGTPACGTNIGSWNGVNAYSNGKCFGNVACTNCDGAGFTIHTSSSNGQTAYGGAWQCVELITRTFDTKYKIWLSNNAGSPLCNSAKSTAGLTVYGPGYNTTTPKPVAGDAIVWNYNGGIGHVALVTGGASSTVTYLQQNWGSTTGYAATGSTSWSGSNFGAPSDSLGGFTPVCWIHANVNAVGTCPYGNGLYCGGNGVTGDPSTLYTCTNGTLTVDRVCSLGCQYMKNYVNDQCQACPNGDGAYCGGTLAKTTSGTLYSCKGGDVAPVEDCSFGCDHVAPQADVCTSPREPTIVRDITAPDTPASQDPQPTPNDGSGCSASPARNGGGAWVFAIAMFALVRRRSRSRA